MERRTYMYSDTSIEANKEIQEPLEKLRDSKELSILEI